MDWLKSLGCVLWLPFEHSTDLNDRISGNDLAQVSGTNGYFAWDSTESMMYYHSPSYRSRKAYTLQTGWSASTFADNEYTVLSEFKRKSTSGIAYFFMLGNTYDIPNGATFLVNVSANMANFGTSLHKTAFFVGEGSRKCYEEGVQVWTGAAVSSQNPSGWGSYDYFIGTCSTGSVTSKEIYVRNVMMFNRELDLSTIRKIQGYE